MYENTEKQENIEAIEEVMSLVKNLKNNIDAMDNQFPIFVNKRVTKDTYLQEYNDISLFRTLEEVHCFGKDKTFGSGLHELGNNSRIGGVLYGLTLAGLVVAKENTPFEEFELSEFGIAKMKELYDTVNTIRKTCSLCPDRESCKAYELVNS